MCHHMLPNLSWKSAVHPLTNEVRTEEDGSRVEACGPCSERFGDRRLVKPAFVYILHSRRRNSYSCPSQNNQEYQLSSPPKLMTLPREDGAREARTLLLCCYSMGTIWMKPEYRIAESNASIERISQNFSLERKSLDVCFEKILF